MRLIPCMKAQDEDEDHSRYIDREIKNWIKNYNDAIKLLLLGTGESGKTTIIKQMKILHIQGFNQSERIEKANHIRHNIHESIYDIVRHMEPLKIVLGNPKNVPAQNYILRCGAGGPPNYDEEYFDYVRALWRDSGVRECFKRSNEYQLIDSAEYFLDRIDLIEKADYLPPDADILRCRQKTSGIQKIEFKVKVPKSMHGGVQDFWMFDVGGQRGERKKWIQVFEGIHAIWFLVACSDYDQTLREDSVTNRLREALTLFEDVWQSRFLLESGLIVFLNKQDLLRRKVERGGSIAPHFPEYNNYQGHGGEYERTRDFIKQMFVDVTQKQKRRAAAPSAERFVVGAAYRARECYFHYTTATDTDNEFVKDVIKAAPSKDAGSAKNHMLSRHKHKIAFDYYNGGDSGETLKKEKVLGKESTSDYYDDDSDSKKNKLSNSKLPSKKNMCITILNTKYCVKQEKKQK